MPQQSRKFALYLGITILFLDLATKCLVSLFLPVMDSEHLWYPYGGVPVFRDFFGVEFSLVHAINYGAAWGLFSNHQGGLLVGRMVLISGVVVYAWRFNRNRSYDIPLALVIGGAIGNVIDYFIYGHVIDMFHFVLWGYDYPVFNVADMAICAGIIWLFMTSSLSDEQPKKKGKR